MIALLAVLLASMQPAEKPVSSVRRAHAHNDYEHQKQLLGTTELRNREADPALTSFSFPP